ncbi:type III secretion protein [Duganella sp. BJB488]|uniref:flagellar biosynthetic protein FliR n=1 Tax=unclassified Duganella TaxID=2636909 RepID=UPI000E34B06E|nr:MULTISPECIES: flagellar biosynthetic protein FliR [unclassified Duganella]NVD69740.1 flagellar biosynthetic protein FliR [Duganella sp. BJB1802]RFP10246.1 type III secretion protein [Duganella sp. BJB489]RFP18155.1 type III secretion protein [Duganella sp. BJB488]RFP37916.1 type III secretion protein [Duganella sp. BJB480]
MEPILSQLLPLLTALWWPFCRILAMFIGAPVLGEAVTPVTVRILIALVLAILMLPLTTGAGAATIDPFSMGGIAASAEQALIGFVLGLAFHFAMSVISVLGFMVSSQMGFSMAVMNDPVNGQSSDVVSALLSVLSIIVFFAIDGHLVIANVIGQSFKAWPLGHGYQPLLLNAIAYNVAWIFSAAMLLAIPVVFSTLVVQLGFGLLNRVAPALNLFALGFSVITIFGLMMLAQVVRFIPDHYVRMTNMVLELIRQQMQAAVHG